MNRPILRLSIFLAFFMSASMSLFAQDVKLYISKKGSTDTSITSIETCKGETVLLKLEPKAPLNLFGFEYEVGGTWKPTNTIVTVAPPIRPLAIQTMSASSSNSFRYRVKYSLNGEDFFYSNIVTVSIINCK